MWMRAGLIVVAMMLVGAPAMARDKKAEAEILKIDKIVATATTVDQVAKYFAPDVAMYDLMAPTIYGSDALKAHTGELLAKLGTFKVDFIKIDVQADNELGFANSTQHFTLFDSKGAPTMSANFRVTDCYRKIGGKWKLVFEHDSFPADMATGKAVFDGK